MRELAVVACLALVVGAIAQTKYATQTRTINAGVLLLDNDVNASGYQENPNPFVWFNLDSNYGTKPAGWTFVNPVCSGVVDSYMSTRWQSIDSSTTPVQGEPLVKSDAGYWEVRLSSLSDSQIAQFDVLSVSITQELSLSAFEREKLRKFVDGGGVLWVDVSGNLVNNSTVVGTPGLDVVNNFPLPFGVLNGAASGPVSADYLNPLLSFPNAITPTDLNAAQTSSTGALATLTASDVTLGSALPLDLEQTLPIQSEAFVDVAADSLGSTLKVGRLGDGFIVLSIRGLAGALNQVLSGGAYDPNNQFYGLSPTFDQGSDAAAKIVVNLISLPSGHSHVQQGSRQTNGSPVDIGSPLLQRWAAPATLADSNFTTNPPALFKGLMVVSVNGGGGTSQINVYNTVPGADLDGTGSSDKGIADYEFGQPQDLLWTSQAIPGPISPPTCIEVPNASGVPTDQIVVIGGDGNLYAFDAFQLDANGHIQGLTAAPYAYMVTPNGGSGVITAGVLAPGPYAPTYQDGMLFVADSQTTGFGNPAGRIWMVDPSRGVEVQSPSGGYFEVGGAAFTSTVINDISGSATVGYIPIQDNSGGVDRVAYVPTRPTAVAGPTSTAGVSSIWIGARGEKPVSVAESGGFLQIATRASLRGLEVYTDAGVADPLGIKLTVIKNGVPMSASDLNGHFPNGAAWINSAGVLTIQETAPFLTPPSSGTDTYDVRIDYTIDWGYGATLSNAIVRGSLYFPDDASRARRVLGSLPLAQDGTLFAVVSSQSTTSPGGDLYAINEYGRGTFRLRYRYSLYDQHNIVESQGDTVSYPSSDPTYARGLLDDQDGIEGLNPAYASLLQTPPLTKLTFSGPPALRGGNLYVPAIAVKSSSVDIPFTVLMAFNANPDPVEIRVSGNLDPGFTIAQPDITSSADRANPTAFSTVDKATYSYTQQVGATSSTIHFDSLMTGPNGAVQNALSTSQPILIRRTGMADMLVEPSNGGTWSPLLWYCVFPGYTNWTAPMATGDNVFFAANSLLPSVLSTGTVGAPQGSLVGMAGSISSQDSHVVQDRLLTWQNQVLQIDTRSGSIVPNPDIRWPQMAGVSDYNAYVVRLLQAALTTPGTGAPATDAIGIAAGDATLATTSPTGIYAYGLADFLVADQGRVARFDASGNTLYTSEGSLQTGPDVDVSNVGNVHGLENVTRAYPMTDTDMVVVEPTSNRVARVSYNGREIRTIDALTLDPTISGHTAFRPDGYNTNEPETLSAPKDVNVYTEYVTLELDGSGNPTYAHEDGSLSYLAVGDGEATGAIEYWVHYVIADSGNRRLVELVDRYQAALSGNTYEVGGPVLVTPVVGGVPGTPEPQLGVLYWHSPASFSGKNWNYNSVARVFVAGADPHYVLAAGIGSATPTSSGTGLISPTGSSVAEDAAGNGGIIVFDGANSTVIDHAYIPPIAADTTWVDGTTPGFLSTARTGRSKMLGSLNSVTMRNVPVGTSDSQLAIMFTDSTGVYEVVQPASGAPAWASGSTYVAGDTVTGSDNRTYVYTLSSPNNTVNRDPTTDPPEWAAWEVQWMLPNEAYTAMRGVNAPYGGAGQPAGAGSPNDESDPTQAKNPKGLVAMYAKRLASGDVLIANSYYGRTRYNTADFSGEVVQVDGTIDSTDSNANVGFGFDKTNFGFGSYSIHLQLPPISGSRSIVVPVFAYRK